MPRKPMNTTPERKHVEFNKRQICSESRYTSMKRTQLLAFLSAAVLLIFSGQSIAQSVADCQACHNDKDLTMEKNGREVSLYTNPKILKASPHSKLSCISCHVGFNPDDVPHKEKITPVQCTSCHKDALQTHKFHASMLNAAKTAGRLQSACKECHGTHNVVAPKNPASPFSSANLNKSCGTCHSAEVATFNASWHGKAVAANVKGAPTCISCHSKSITPSSGLSKLDLKIAQEKLCLSCHQNDDDVKSRMATSAGFIDAYEHSIHGMSLHRGNADAANCIDCHGAHEVAPGSVADSKVNKLNIPTTCGKCHDAIKTEFNESIHGSALARGVRDAPSCTDCHGEHGILAVDSKQSPVNSRNLPEKVCLPCHNSVRMADKYGIVANPGESYLDSYHGLAVQGGSKVAANCASCHGAHSIKPSSDSTSSIHPSNLKQTCGKCHPNASESFTKGPIHVVRTEKESGIQYTITTIYILLIVLTIGGMLFHNLLDFRKKALEKLKARRRGHQHEVAHNLYLRMTLSERIQHATLALSFILLVFTGFGLTYPNAWWVVYIREILGEPAFELRGVLHRIAGAVMLAASLYHIWYMVATKRGRQFIKDMLPIWKDVKDALQAFKWYLGRTGDRPRFDRFSYMEKAEYWALIWGTIVMGATGLMLWFHEFFGAMTSKEFLDIMTIIHFYEAWLATLAIIVWHFYFIIFNPDVYPMNVAWFKGTLTEHEMLEEHPLELERLKAKAGDVTIITDDEESVNGAKEHPQS